MEKSNNMVVTRHASHKVKDSVRTRTALGNIKKAENVAVEKMMKTRLRSSSDKKNLDGRQAKKLKESSESREPQLSKYRQSSYLTEKIKADSNQNQNLIDAKKNKDICLKTGRITAISTFPCSDENDSLCLFDVEDKENELLCYEYAHEIYEYNKKIEDFYAPTIYMHYQDDLTGRMRTVLIDWIIEVHDQLQLDDSTLFLTCNIIDRYLMTEQVHRTKFQLLGVAAMLISSKHEEIYPPDPDQCVHLTDNAYSKREVLEMEYKILTVLKFDVTVPTIWSFMQRIHKIADSTEIQKQRSNFYSQICLQEHDILAFKPSMIGSACIWLARSQDKSLEDAWPSSLEQYCKVDPARMLCCASMIIKYLNAENLASTGRSLTAVRDKYRKETHFEVAKESIPHLPAVHSSDGTFRITL